MTGKSLIWYGSQGYPDIDNETGGWGDKKRISDLIGQGVSDEPGEGLLEDDIQSVQTLYCQRRLPTADCRLPTADC